MSTLSRALEIARAAHAGQVDKAGRPYIEHVLRVVDAVEGDDAKIVAALHDVLEDSPTIRSPGELGAIGPFPRDITDDVWTLTDTRTTTYKHYLAWIACGSNRARAVKIADLRDNSDPARLALLPEKDRTRLAEKYAAALAALGADPAFPLSQGEGT